MARRRVNTKFLIILTVVVVGLGMSGLIVAKLRRGDPEKYVKAANALVAEGNHTEAVKNFQQALSIEARQPDVWVAYGDAHAQLAPEDDENIRHAINAWRQALQLDPSNKLAMSRMLAVRLAQVERPSSDLQNIITEGRELAARLAAADPSDLTAASAGPLFTVRGAQHGVQTDPERLAEAVKQLVDLSAKHPENPELAARATSAKLIQAQLAGNAQPAQARELINEAGAVMEASLKAAPTSAAMQFQAFQIFSIQGNAAQNPELRQERLDAAKAALAEALKLVKPDDDAFHAIYMVQANQLRGADRPAAEKLVRELLAAKPNDPNVRLSVAEWLATDPSKRGEAIEILERPLAPQPVDPAKILAAGSSEIPILLALTNLRLDEFAATSDPAARQAMHAKIEEGISKYIARVSGGADHPYALRLRGKYQRLRGENVAAIQTLSKAVSLMEAQGMSREGMYLDTLNLLAHAYVDTKQHGPAKELLGRIVQQVPTHVPSRLLLAQLLVRERDVDAARPHIDFLEKQFPDLPNVIKLRLATLDGEKDKEQIDAVYARLPETTRGEILEKAATAHVLGRPAEVERLLSAQLAQTPGDPGVSMMLARAYAAQDQRDKATRLITEALAAHPENRQLQFEQKRLANASPEEMRQWRMESIEELTDPTQKAIQLAELAAGEGKPDEALKQLQEAEHASPDNLSIKKALFDQHLARRQWAEAGRYADLLAKANHDQADGLLYRLRLALAKARSAATPAEQQAEAARAAKYGLELTQRLPQFGESWLAYGQALQAQGKLQEATERFATALEKQPDNFEAMRGMIESYAALNRPADVKRYIDAGLRLSPNNAYFIEQQTMYELAYGDPTRALPQREATLKNNPDNPQAWSAMAQAYFAAARFHTAKQNEAGAKEMLAKAADTLKQAMAKFPDEAGFYASYVEAALALKDPAGAETAIKQLAARDAWKDKPEPQLMMAEFLARTGKLDESEALLRELVAKRPADVNIQLALVSLLTQRGKADDALAALAANSSDPRVRQQLVQLQMNLGKLEEADKTIQTALAADPKSVPYQALSGFISMNRGRWDEADQRLQAALKLDPRNPIALFYHGLVRLNQPTPNLDEAVQRLTAAREAQPAGNLLVEIRAALAQALAARNDIEGAARELEAALAAQPNNKQLRMSLINVYMSGASPRFVDAERTIREGRELNKNDPDLLLAEARMWLGRNDSRKAVAAVRQAVAAAPESDQLKYELLNTLLAAADYPALIKEADQMLGADKNRWWAYMFRGAAKRSAGERDSAIQDFETALTMAGEQGNENAAQEVIGRLASTVGIDHALDRILPRAKTENRWRMIAAQLYFQKQDHDRAAEMIERVLVEGDKLSPQERARALGLAGTIYLSDQPAQAEKAHQVYLKLLDIAPNDWAALNNMASLLTDTVTPPRPQEALKYSQRAYDIVQSSGLRSEIVLDTHGWALTLNGKAHEGIDLLRRAIAMRSFPHAHYHLGEAYLKTAAPEDAQKQLELAAEQLRQQEQKKQQVDQALLNKVEAALLRAKESIRSKSAAAAP
ncbi:MAG TPA: tetratricopeptide repeat protein [Tepidisphaeraceae bacterium]|nr:tetratricopeptide repeat protein [Tepidisphaeraceae bacterium]